MSSLAALYALYCYCDYDPTPEDIELARKLAEEQKEREKHMIVSAYQFGQLARTDPESGALGVKFLRDKNGVFHWMDTKIWQFHYTYCVSNLDEKRTLQEFNEQVYTGKDRSMMFATVVAYRGPDRKYCCLELNPADPMNDIDFVETFFKETNWKFSYDSEPLYFHPTSPAQLAAVKGANLSLPIITSDVLFSGIKYNLVQAGTITQKKVCIFNKPQYTEDDLNKWLLQRTADEVVVIPRVPNDIPVVGGVICGEIIPPLCHVALLCQNRKTPCCFAQNCLQLMEEGHFSPSAKTVASGVITKKGFYLDGEAPSTNVPEENPHVEVPQANTSVTNLIDIHEDKQHAKDIHIVGAKAAQLAAIESSYNQPIFTGTFVIPFHHYNKHVHQNTVISSALGKLPQVSKSNPFTDYHIKGYNLFQEIIQKEKADDEIVQSVIEKIKQYKMTSVIFRSSTNAEDLTGFNGAGLYESVPLFGDNVHDPQQVEAAIKKVWASVWNVKAVKERDHYQIPHDNVNMAVIVQPFIDEHMKGIKVHYNGVCITHDIVHHKLKHGFTISCYPGHALRATNYYNDKAPEQAVLLLGRATNSVDVQVNATATGQPYSLITQQDAEKMVSVFGSLHTSMLNKPHKLDDTVALDIEFMVVSSVKDLKKRDLVVLQARPYNVNVTVDTEALDKEFITFAEANFGYSLHSASKVYLSNIVNNYCASKETNTLY